MHSNRLASGPAATIAIRCHTDLRLNAWLRSATVTSASRSSSIFTYPPSGIAPITNSVPELLRRDQSGVPKPIEKRRTLTPQRRATQ